MNKYEKGQYGYLNSYRRSKLIGVTIFSIMIIAVVVGTLLMFGDTSRVIIVIAILMSLPLAKYLIALIVVGGCKSLNSDEHNKIAEKYKNKDGALLFDMNISRYEGLKFYQSMFVKNGKIYALVLNKDFADKKKEYESWIIGCITSDKYKYKIVVFKDIDEYIKKINAVSEPNDNNLLIDRHVREEILSAGV